jgi:hypothetical protein
MLRIDAHGCQPGERSARRAADGRGQRALQLALLFTSVLVVAQSMVRNEWGNQLYYGTTLIAVFGYLFLTSRTKEEERDSPWWW